MPAHPQRGALALLVAGAIGIGFAPIFVRLSEIGPVATAGYRVLFALPFLWLLTLREGSARPSEARPTKPGGDWLMFATAGFFFAADLSLWHWSIKMTTVANSTLITNLAPFFVMLGGRTLFGERLTPSLIAGALCALIGCGFLVGSSLSLSREHVAGDFLALVTAVFYAGYLLTVKRLRRGHSASAVMAKSGVVSCALFFLVAAALDESLWPNSPKGWVILILLAAICHAAGQTLIASGMAHLPASFSALSLLLQPVVAAICAAVLLNERLAAPQIAGGIVVLLGIAIGTLMRNDASSSPS